MGARAVPACILDLLSKRVQTPLFPSNCRRRFTVRLCFYMKQSTHMIRCSSASRTFFYAFHSQMDTVYAASGGTLNLTQDFRCATILLALIEVEC